MRQFLPFFAFCLILLFSCGPKQEQDPNDPYAGLPPFPGIENMSKEEVTKLREIRDYFHGKEFVDRAFMLGFNRALDKGGSPSHALKEGGYSLDGPFKKTFFMGYEADGKYWLDYGLMEPARIEIEVGKFVEEPNKFGLRNESGGQTYTLTATKDGKEFSITDATGSLVQTFVPSTEFPITRLDSLNRTYWVGNYKSLDKKWPDFSLTADGKVEGWDEFDTFRHPQDEFGGYVFYDGSFDDLIAFQKGNKLYWVEAQVGHDTLTLYNKASVVQVDLDLVQDTLYNGKMGTYLKKP